MADVVKVAESCGLSACAAVLRAFPAQLPQPASPDGALAAPLAGDTHRALAQLVRRGLDARLVSIVRASLADRPLERGLLAWDALSGSLFRPADSMLEEMRRDARAVRAVLPEAGARCVRPGQPAAEELGDELGVEPLRKHDHTALLQAASDFVLGAPELLWRAGDADARLLDLWLEWARLLHRAHLSTLSSFYLDTLWSRFHHAPALPALVEVLLDCAVSGVTEWLEAQPLGAPETRPPRAELVLYAKVRSALNARDTAALVEWVAKDRALGESSGLSPDDLGRRTPWSNVAYTDVGILHGVPTLSLPAVSAAATSVPAWRYGTRVMTVLAARDSNRKSRDFAALVDRFLESFGNDFRLWYDSARQAGQGCAWMAALLERLVREIEHLPHDPEVWKSAAWLCGGTAAAKAAVAEVDDRRRAQCLLDAS